MTVPPSQGVSSGLKKSKRRAQLDIYYILISQNHKVKRNTVKKTKYSGLVIYYTPKDNSIPKHNIIVLGSPTDASRRILLQSFKIPHQSLPRRSRHLHHLYLNQTQFRQ